MFIDQVLRMSSKNSKVAETRKDRGIAMVIFAILLPLILGFIAFVIDYGRAVSAIQQARGHARLLALGAVEQYYKESERLMIPGQPMPSVDAVLAGILPRMREMRLINTTINNPSHERYEDVQISDGERTDNSTDPIIIPGRYFTDLVPKSMCEPQGTTPAQIVTCEVSTSESICPTRRYPGYQGNPDRFVQECSPCGIGKRPPCFVSRAQERAAGNSNPTPSAFKVEGRLYPPMAVQFARMLVGDVQMPMSVSAVASIVPRRLVVVDDISNSSATDTYVDRGPTRQLNDPAGGRGSRYTYPRRVPAIPATNPMLSIGNPDGSYPSVFSYNRVMDPSVRNFDAFPAWKVLRNGRIPAPPPPNQYSPSGVARGDLVPGDPLLTNRKVHFYDDYTYQRRAYLSDDAIASAGAYPVKPMLHPNPGDCLTAGNNQSEYCVASDELEFMVDTHCFGSTDPDCAGPQPLKTIWAGLISAVDTFRDRRVAGDKMGMVFFERKTPWGRIVKPTDDFDYLKQILGPSADSEALRVKLGIFPTGESFTDANQAIAEAVTLLSTSKVDAPGLITHDDILLITDGLTNCVPCILSGGFLVDQLDFDGDGRVTINDIFVMLNCYFGLDQPQCHRPGVFIPHTVDEFHRALYGILNSVGNTCNLPGGTVCSDDYDHYRAAMNQLQDNVRQNSGLNVAINVLATGSSIGPNTKDVKVGGHCLTDAEARALLPNPRDPVDQGCTDDTTCNISYQNKSSDTPFTAANRDLYYLARASGGEFAPLLSEKEDFCPTNNDPSPCIADPDSPQCCTDGLVRTKDKLCRTPKKQVEDLIFSILKKQTPFAVVESR